MFNFRYDEIGFTELPINTIIKEIECYLQLKLLICDKKNIYLIVRFFKRKCTFFSNILRSFLQKLYGFVRLKKNCTVCIFFVKIYSFVYVFFFKKLLATLYLFLTFVLKFVLYICTLHFYFTFLLYICTLHWFVTF